MKLHAREVWCKALAPPFEMRICRLKDSKPR